jgi:hypothetical protein
VSEVDTCNECGGPEGARTSVEELKSDEVDEVVIEDESSRTKSSTYSSRPRPDSNGSSLVWLWFSPMRNIGANLLVMFGRRIF